MAINLKTEEGFEFSFDTVEELMEFTQRMNEVTESTSDEDTSEYEPIIPGSSPKFEEGDEVRVVENTSSGHVEGTIGEIIGVRYDKLEDIWYYEVRPISGHELDLKLIHKESELELSGIESKVEVGDKVRIVSSEDGTHLPYHYHDVGSVGKVVSIQLHGRIEVEIDYETQYLLPHHYVKVEPLGQDANGEDLYEGDYVTGTEDNTYGNTNDKEVMEVLGVGKSDFFEEANILVSIVGYSPSYKVDSSQFIKLSDNLDEAKAKFKEIKGEVPARRGLVEDNEYKVGDVVRVIGNSHGHLMTSGEVREIKDVDSEEPKYNLSEVSQGYWAGTSDIEPAHSSAKLRTGDIVRVMEAFEDTFGDQVSLGGYYSYDENLLIGEPFVGTVFLGDNRDKIELVCRAGDRLDK